MGIIKIALLGIVVAIIALTVKSFKPDMGVFVSIAAGVVLMLYIIAEISGVIDSINQAITKYGLNTEYVGVVIKALGIAYTTQFAADICKDSGEAALGTRIELFGRVMIIASALPLVLSILEMVLNMFELA